ncbi:hypothetical protein [Pseudomonas sp. YuFO8]|jgi:hypothetical protein|uniref:hypothetical protein n=1 Tax=unclassified Pseudomonas TaxID=196821 RepID=UPI002B249B53|nr:hypothetical protein [Pseudomonas sp. YuFO8]MEB2626195.1 hypothetical protein [Pseudomonas sp. YuFO8]
MSKHEADDKITFEIHTPETEVPAGKSVLHLDDENNVLGGQVYGHVIEKIEGGMKVTRPDGATMVMRDGSVTIENLVPKSIGIRNLSEIESFAVRTQNHTRIFRMDFVGGGHVEVTYAHDGQVREVTGQNLQQTISKDNAIIVRQGDSSTGQTH